MTAPTALKPMLSIVVIFHNMQREALRTLYTLSARYQQGVDEADYEIIAVDNASSEPLDPDALGKIAGNIQYHFFETASRSPVDAVNFGAAQASGDSIAVIVDGARMVTPNIIRKSIDAMAGHRVPFVCALGWHLGPDVQPKAIANGYNQDQEDALLKQINWRENGYGLFDIASIASSSGGGFLSTMPSECSWFAMPKKAFEALGGFDPQFQTPGGGYVNQDFLKRALDLPNLCPIVLLGEGSFHQMHGGIATNSSLDNRPIEMFKDEYTRIRGEKYSRSQGVVPFYYGDMAPQAVRFVKGCTITPK